MKKLVLLLTCCSVLWADYIELCCSFQEKQKASVTVLSGLLDGFGFKLLMGCSNKPHKRCGCFQPVSGCQVLPVTSIRANKRRTMEVTNGQPITIFNHVMRTLHGPSRPTKDTYHLYACNDAAHFTPYIWAFMHSDNVTWSSRQRCTRAESVAQIQLSTHTQLDITKFDTSIRLLLKGYSVDPPDFDKMTEEVGVELSAASEYYYNQVLEQIQHTSDKFLVTRRLPGTRERLQREEIVLKYSDILCRSYNITDCLTVANSLHKDKVTHAYHVPHKLLELYLTTANTPGVLVVYRPGSLAQSQEVVGKLDASLAVSTLESYTLGVMEETGQYKAGLYYLLVPNTLRRCPSEEVFECVAEKLQVYLPLVRSYSKIVNSVFGEQHIGAEDTHRGNLNDLGMYDVEKMEHDNLGGLIDLVDLREKLQGTTRATAEVTGAVSSLTLLTTETYRDTVLTSGRGYFVLFVFLSDLASLHTVDKLLKNPKLEDLYLVECFHLNLLCDDMDINSYPVVYFVRSNTTTRYTGALSAGSFATFRSLIQFPVVSPADQAQVDDILKGTEHKAAVLVSDNKSTQQEYAKACQALWGKIQCFTLTPEAGAEEALIAHVPSDPVMINKNYYLTNLHGDKAPFSGDSPLYQAMVKLTTHSVISEQELLTVYQDFTEYLLFDGVLDNSLAAIVSLFPEVQFVQLSSTHFKHAVLRELVGYDYNNTVLYISRDTSNGYEHNGAELEVWIRDVRSGKAQPSFTLRDLEQSKYLYQDIYYKQAYGPMKGAVSELKERIMEFNGKLGDTVVNTHQEL